MEVGISRTLLCMVWRGICNIRAAGLLMMHE
jgi:hypothetical protein